MAFFVAFYSYKGGVGRTLALANVAYSLASRGKRVVMIDMDLEAPALLGFPKFAVKGKTPKKGFIEYAASYRKRGVCPSIKHYVHACQVSPGAGQLWVMPSGRLDASYQKTLASLPWRRLHPRKGTPPLAESLRQALEKEFQPHYVLVDSRTGLSDIGGLSTHLLADMVVLVFNLTKECIEGSIRAYHAFTSEAVKVRAIQLVASPIPPVVPSEDSLVEERIRQAKEHMPQAVASDRKVIRILYDPSMALSEDLAVLKPEIFAAAERYEDLREEIQRSNDEEVFRVVEQAHRRRAEGRWEDGLEQLRTFVGEHPRDAEGHMELGKYLLEAGRAEEASRCFRSATSLAEGLAIAHRKLGEALVAAGKHEDAISSLGRALDLGDSSQELLDALAKQAAILSGEMLGTRGRSLLLALERPETHPPRKVQESDAVDLEIHVTTEGTTGGTSLRYLLHSANGKVGFTYYHVAVNIRRNLSDYRALIISKLEKLSSGIGDGVHLLPDEIYSELMVLGRNLYFELFPPEMRAAYRHFREIVKTILIVSDESWIPWELIKPYDDDDPAVVIDDDFLCAHFQLTRWLSEAPAPATMIKVEKLACFEAGIVPDESPAPYADEELQWLRGLARRHPTIADRSLPQPTYKDLIARLEEGELGIMHFVGHGRFNPVDFDESGISLTDGRSFRPLDLYGPIRSQIRRQRPLIFLNVSLGGWAQRWVKDCGCGAFIAPSWSVDDQSAFIFATAFYSALERDETIGRAVQEARFRVREEAPHSTAWLAYTAYAHPNARLRLGTGT